MTKKNPTFNYFVFCFAENYPPICIGMFSGEYAIKAVEKAREDIHTNPKHRALVGMSTRFQVAKAVH